METFILSFSFFLLGAAFTLGVFIIFKNSVLILLRDSEARAIKHLANQVSMNALLTRRIMSLEAQVKEHIVPKYDL